MTRRRYGYAIMWEITLIVSIMTMIDRRSWKRGGEGNKLLCCFDLSRKRTHRFLFLTSKKLENPAPTRIPNLRSWWNRSAVISSAGKFDHKLSPPKPGRSRNYLYPPCSLGISAQSFHQPCPQGKRKKA